MCMFYYDMVCHRLRYGASDILRDNPLVAYRYVWSQRRMYGPREKLLNINLIANNVAFRSKEITNPLYITTVEIELRPQVTGMMIF